LHGPQAAQARTADDYFAEGVRLYEAGESEKAIEAYRAALKLDARHFGARFNLGGMYMFL